MREALKHLALELSADLRSVVAGGTTVLRLSITNKARSEVVVLFDAIPAGAAPRADWSRLAGMPEVRPPDDGHKLVIAATTLDARERSVDGLPPVPASGAAPVLLAVRLRPGAKLTHSLSWWAYRIPAAAPAFRDDAGHRIVPKTAPVPLPPGDYTVRLELPLHGVSPAEASVTTPIRVEAAPKPAKPHGAGAH